MVFNDLLKVLNGKQLVKIVCNDLSSGYLEMYAEDCQRMLNAVMLYRWVKEVKIIEGFAGFPILKVTITNKIDEVIK